MKKIYTYEEYIGPVRQVKQDGRAAGKKVYTNCYFLKNAIMQMLEKESLLLHEQDGNLYILEDGGNFFRLYYYAVNLETVTPLPLEKNAVIEFPFRDQILEQQELEVGFIERLGFRLCRKSGEMSLKAEEFHALDEKLLDFFFRDPKVQFGLAVPEDQERIKELIYGTFNELYAFLPDDEELREHIDSGRVHVLRYGDELMASLDLDLSGETNTGRGTLAVVREYRKGGWGAVIYSECMKIAVKNVKKFIIWVDLDNVKAISMYKRFGFKFEALYANEYVFGETLPSIR